MAKCSSSNGCAIPPIAEKEPRKIYIRNRPLKQVVKVSTDIFIRICKACYKQGIFLPKWEKRMFCFQKPLSLIKN